MSKEYRARDWETYRMDTTHPHVRIEPMECERETTAAALELLRSEGILPHTHYDENKLLAHRKAVEELFEIPWTAITHRMQRMIWAINAIVQPRNMIAAGIFCGNTFISNAGAAVGPGAVYTAHDLVGVEILPNEAERAERNVRRIDPTGVAHIVAADAVDIARDYPERINLLYLDADGDEARGKGIYLDILLQAYDKMPKGSLVLAHNSVNCAERLKHYLAFVRNPANMANSVNIVIDGEGLEVSLI
jgi:predicted O-methyltransferase YrrM